MNTNNNNTKYKIEIIPDDSPSSPREWSNVGKMICFHGRYNLGDDHSYTSDMFSSFDEMEEKLIKDFRNDIILPLYLYDHSGITMSTSPFSCRWDSGQVGFIIVDRDSVREITGWKRITSFRKRVLEAYLEGEVKIYDQYITGDVYGYRITDTETEEEIDSCWGFYGEEYAQEEADSMVEYLLNNQ